MKKKDAAERSNRAGTLQLNQYYNGLNHSSQQYCSITQGVQDQSIIVKLYTTS